MFVQYLVSVPHCSWLECFGFLKRTLNSTHQPCSSRRIRRVKEGDTIDERNASVNTRILKRDRCVIYKLYYRGRELRSESEEKRTRNIEAKSSLARQYVNEHLVFPFVTTYFTFISMKSEIRNSSFLDYRSIICRLSCSHMVLHTLWASLEVKRLIEQGLRLQQSLAMMRRVLSTFTAKVNQALVSNFESESARITQTAVVPPCSHIRRIIKEHFSCRGCTAL